MGVPPARIVQATHGQDARATIAIPTRSRRTHSCEHTWKTVTPGGTSSANRIQWIDNGQPKTECFPTKQLNRFYRVITVQ